MSFTPGFENDIFISFCHYDNAAPSNEKGWVDLFHEGLESWLMRRFGHKKVSIWRDKELQGNTLFDDRIREQIRKSALFFDLLSPNYLKSEYCLKELEWFHREAGKSRCGLSVNNECRIFNVLLNNVHHSQWPKQLQGTSGFPMHDQKEGSESLGDFLDYDDKQYRKKLGKIVESVDIILRLFPGAGAEMAKGNGAAAESLVAVEELRIFIADTADSLQNTREKLVEDLNKSFCGVQGRFFQKEPMVAEGKSTVILPRIPPPWDGPGHEAAIKQAVDEAELAVHLLDGWPGRKIEEENALTFPCAQVEIALRSRTRQLVWVPKDMEFKEIEDREYAKFLESLERGEREKVDFEFIKEEKTDLPRLVRQTLGQIRRQREVKREENNAPLLLDTHQKDQRFAFKLGEYLNGKGLSVEFNQESRDPAAGLRHFEEASSRYAAW